MTHDIHLIGIPMDSGKRRRGCLMGPDAYRTAGLAEALSGLGHAVTDHGNLAPDPVEAAPPAPHVHAWAETIGWTRAIRRAAEGTAPAGIPVFMGGDHALSLGSVTGMAAVADAEGAPLFVLWIDAHTDFHTPLTSDSGNLHGTPMGYAAGREGFDGFPDLAAPIPLERVGMIGLRSVDPPEREALEAGQAWLADMRAIDEDGIRAPLAAFLDRVAEAGGRLHVSLDVDFLDPSVAPAVGTTVPGGGTVREGHLIMEMISDSGLLRSLDLVELNPFLDERGRTASLMVDLAASLFGRRVFDRPTRSYTGRTQ
ncbi:arginase [Wenxinia saemankumensis]|uniref:Arginase n=1 Tax=Wenxinia saemankumensis TaxID=1447782 RepID=A0A1M6A1Q7_9RHOB|nr:arginase [Wenxinia saemankumensis]SHI30365.1 arginase [Wenxinia saemankumensis]